MPMMQTAMYSRRQDDDVVYLFPGENALKQVIGPARPPDQAGPVVPSETAKPSSSSGVPPKLQQLWPTHRRVFGRSVVTAFT